MSLPAKIVLLIILFIALVLSIRFSKQSVYSQNPTWVENAKNNYNRHSTLPDGVENRVMFDEDISWALSRENTDKIIARLADAGFNIYIPCVWHGAGAYYSSSIAYLNPQTQARIQSGDDPLTYLVQRAHEKNIKIHAWVTISLRDDDKYKDYYNYESHKNAFEIHNIQFRKFIISLVLEVAKNYNIDGINLDYIRSIGYCKSKQCQKDYHEKYSRSLLIDLLINRFPGSHLKTIEAWNEEAVEDVVKSISLQSRILKPDLIISIDGIPEARDFRLQGQNSLKWLDNKWIDAIFYMEYHKDFKIEKIEAVKLKTAKPDNIIPLLSLYDISTLEQKPGELLKNYVAAARKVWPNSGIAFYHYKQLNDSQITALKSSVYAKFAYPSLSPPSP